MVEGFRIISPGLQTSIQDNGRFGYQWSGMCPSGAMDMHSLRVANILVGNDRNEAGLEVMYIGPTLEMQVDSVIAITGANLSPVVDGKPIPMYQAVSVKQGQRISFGKRIDGCRAYITFAGGLDTPVLYNSRSTLLRTGIGGLDGKALKAGEEIALRKAQSMLPCMGSRIAKNETISGSTVTVRVIPGPQDYLFSEEGITNFYSCDGFTVTAMCDRQGYRLKGPKVFLKEKGSIVSDGIAKGAIQIPPNEQPIILLSERQSTGGYAKIGNVISVDISAVAQTFCGSKIVFARCTVEEAEELLREEDYYFERLERQIRQACEDEYAVLVNGDIAISSLVQVG